MFKEFKKLKKYNQFIYSLLIAVCIVAIWRGTWILLDLYVFPNNQLLSSIVPLILGAIILAITHHKLS